LLNMSALRRGEEIKTRKKGNDQKVLTLGKKGGMHFRRQECCRGRTGTLVNVRMGELIKKREKCHSPVLERGRKKGSRPYIGKTAPPVLARGKKTEGQRIGHGDLDGGGGGRGEYR